MQATRKDTDREFFHETEGSTKHLASDGERDISTYIHAGSTKEAARKAHASLDEEYSPVSMRIIMVMTDTGDMCLYKTLKSDGEIMSTLIT